MLDKVSTIIRTSVAALCVTALIAGIGQPARAGQKVVIAAGTQVLNITYPWLLMPLALGYWKDEGYDVDVIPAGGSSQAIQQLVGGGADLVQVNSTSLISVVANDKVDLKAVMTNTVLDWSLVSLKSGPVQSLKDFKGKAIGVSSLGTGGIPLLKAYLKNNGISPDKDIQIVPVGFGPTALNALRNNDVQGLMYWGSAIASFENAGAKLNYFRAKSWSKMADFSMATSSAKLAKEGDMIAAIVRGSAEASLFAATNPTCAREIFWKKFPDMKAHGDADEKALAAWDDNSLKSSLQTMATARKLKGYDGYAGAPASGYGTVAKMMLDNSVISKTVDQKDLVVNPSFFKKANDFDKEKIIEQAKACRVS